MESLQKAHLAAVTQTNYDAQFDQQSKEGVACLFEQLQSADRKSELLTKLSTVVSVPTNLSSAPNCFKRIARRQFDAIFTATKAVFAEVGWIGEFAHSGWRNGDDYPCGNLTLKITIPPRSDAPLPKQYQMLTVSNQRTQDAFLTYARELTTQAQYDQQSHTAVHYYLQQLRAQAQESDLLTKMTTSVAETANGSQSPDCLKRISRRQIESITAAFDTIFKPLQWKHSFKHSQWDSERNNPYPYGRLTLMVTIPEGAPEIRQPSLEHRATLVEFASWAKHVATQAQTDERAQQAVEAILRQIKQPKNRLELVTAGKLSLTLKVNRNNETADDPLSRLARRQIDKIQAALNRSLFAETWQGSVVFPQNANGDYPWGEFKIEMRLADNRPSAKLVVAAPTREEMITGVDDLLLDRCKALTAHNLGLEAYLQRMATMQAERNEQLDKASRENAALKGRIQKLEREAAEREARQQYDASRAMPASAVSEADMIAHADAVASEAARVERRREAVFRMLLDSDPE